MKKFSFCLALVFLAAQARAESVILMIGDGMSEGHIDCVAKDKQLFFKTKTPNLYLRTASANNVVTDSAAAATAYSCGIKTNNEYLGIDAAENSYLTIAEEMADKGKAVYILSSDSDYGATPSAFYAHTTSRHNEKDIKKYLNEARKKMDIRLNIGDISAATDELLTELTAQDKEFFVMIEEAHIDKCSHRNEYQCMEDALVRFDSAVQKVFAFADSQKAVKVFVTADHETGGLTDECRFTLHQHTNRDVPLYSNYDFSLSNGKTENIELYKYMKKILLNEN